MNRKFASITFIILLSGGIISAQEGMEEFKPHGRQIIKVYTNYHSTFTDEESSKAFEIQRAYFGYQYDLSEKISGRLILDVGNPNFGDFHMTAYLKNAYVQYTGGRLIAKIGMIGLEQFKLQEEQWGGRYLYKSFMDEHKFGPSADLAAFVAYQIHNLVGVDLTIANGDGYKSLETDSIFKYSIGMTLTPVQGLDVRASYDYMGKDNPQQTLAFYAGYSLKNMKLGAEYNYQFNHRMEADHDLNGLSFYGSYQLKQIRFFGRYDRLFSTIIAGNTDPWNYGKDGHLFISGVEFNPVKGLKLTPNYQGWIPANGNPLSHSAYLSIEIRF